MDQARLDSGIWSHQRLLLLLVLALFVATIPTRVAAQAPGQQSGASGLMTVVSNRTDLSVFGALAASAGLVAELSNSSTRLTGLLPNNAAFDAFAASLGLAANGSALGEALSAGALRRLLRYHVLPELVTPGGANASVDTLLRKDYLGSPSLGLVYFSNQSGDPRVNGTTSGSSAGFVSGATDIAAGPNGLVSVIDSVLTYWYSNVSEALSQASNVSYFVRALELINATSRVNSATFRGALFVPPDQTWQASSVKYNFLLPSPDQSSAADLTSLAVWQNLVAITADVNVTDPLGYAGNVTYRTLSKGNTVITTVNGGDRSQTSFGTLGKLLATFDAGRVTIKAVGSSADVLYALPVGGPEQSTTVYVINDVLMPIYTTPWQFLSDQANYTVFQALVQKLADAGRTGLLTTLTKPSSSSLTILAPSNEGITRFLKRYNAASLESVLPLGAALESTLEAHLLVGAVPMASLKSGARFLTRLGEYVTVQAPPFNLPNMSFVAAKTTATLQGRVDVDIHGGGRSLVHTVNYLLVPSTVTLPDDTGGGAAGAAVPSFILFAVSLLAARIAMTAAGLRL